jgi:hypothetical protein
MHAIGMIFAALVTVRVVIAIANGQVRFLYWPRRRFWF